MKAITLQLPPRIVFGDGCSANCFELFAQRQARRILLVSSTPVLKNTGSLLQAAQKAGLSVIQSPPVDAEPTITTFMEICKFAQAEKVEGVLGIGGGSAMDVAKLVAGLVGRRQTVQEVFGINLLAGRDLPLVCAPTTAGTGSEVSPTAVLLDEGERLKKGVVSPHLVTDAAYIDPLLTHSVPSNVTAATGLDALTHCIEAYTNKFAHPMIDLYALEGIRLISSNLRRAVRNGGDAQARASMALGSLYGGLCLGPVNTAAVHALAYPLGGQFRIAHGVSNALLLPHVIRFNLPATPDRYAKMAVALGEARDGSAAATAERGAARLFELSRECGVPQRLSELGVPREAIGQMAQAAMKVTRLLKNNPRPLSEEDAIAIYSAAY